MAMDPDHQHAHAHAHGTGIKWLDIIVGLSAMFISVVSLAVSIEHGRTMDRMVQQNERMVAASTMPFLTLGGNQFDPETRMRRERLVLTNAGVGPAVIDWFEIRYKGRGYATLGDLLRACCAQGLSVAQMDHGVYYSNVSGTVLPAREEVAPIDIQSKADPRLMDALERARGDLDVRACYCSVLEECWLTDFNPGRPKRVQSCKAPKGVATF